MSYTSLGRLAAARLAYDTLWILDPGGEDGFIVLSPLMAGLVDSTFAPAAWAFIWQENPDPTYEMGMNYLRGLLSLNLGHVAEARSFLQTGLSIDGEFDADALFRAALALVDIVEGDTVGGVARLKTELQAAGYGRDALFLGSPLRIQLAYLQIDNPETRREGINRLLYGLNKFTDFPYIVPSLLVAAQALEEEGDPAAAARAYSLFVHHWEGADPELLPRVETARRALERLSRESMN